MIQIKQLAEKLINCALTWDVPWTRSIQMLMFSTHPHLTNHSQTTPLTPSQLQSLVGVHQQIQGGQQSSSIVGITLQQRCLYTGGGGGGVRGWGGGRRGQHLER